VKRSIEVDEELLKKAMEASGAKTYAETVEAALRDIVHRRASEALPAFLGTEPDAEDVPRRREPAA
jgi:Arc/MetJ family transcription regulator